MRQIRHGEHELLEPRIQFGDPLVGPLDLLGNALHLGHQVVGLFARALAARDLFAGAITLGLEPFGRGDPLAAFAVKFPKARKVDLHVAISSHLLELRQMLAEISQIVHRPDRIP